MGCMKRFLEEVATSMGERDISKPAVVAEAQRRLDRERLERLQGIEVEAYGVKKPALSILEALTNEEISQALEPVLEELLQGGREVRDGHKG